MDIDRPDVVAEVTAAFADYERALAAGDVGALGAWFWSSPLVTRFGIADHQTGAEALHAWRAAQPPIPPGRRLFDTKVTTFGSDLATVTTMFDYPPGSPAAAPAPPAPLPPATAAAPSATLAPSTALRALPGRQSQTWVRFPAAGWRIVHAHVSHPSA